MILAQSVSTGTNSVDVLCGNFNSTLHAAQVPGPTYQEQAVLHEA